MEQVCFPGVPVSRVEAGFLVINVLSGHIVSTSSAQDEINSPLFSAGRSRTSKIFFLSCACSGVGDFCFFSVVSQHPPSFQSLRRHPVGFRSNRTPLFGTTVRRAALPPYFAPCILSFVVLSLLSSSGLSLSVLPWGLGFSSSLSSRFAPPLAFLSFFLGGFSRPSPLFSPKFSAFNRLLASLLVIPSNFPRDTTVVRRFF